MAYLLLAVTPLLWAGNWTIAKPLVQRVDPLDVALLRWILASLLLVPAVRWREETLPVPRGREWPGLLLAGLTGMAGYNTLQYVAQQHTSNVNGTLIYTATPALTFLIAVPLLGEVVTPRRVVGVLLSLAGTAWILTGGSATALLRLDFNPGDLLMLVAASSWAIYTVTGRFLMHRLSPLATTLYASITGAAVLAVVRAGRWLAGEPLPSLGGRDLLAVLYIGGVASAAAYLFWNEGVRRIGAGPASIFGNLLPVYTALLSGLFLGERVTASQVAGGLAVLAGVYLVAAPAGAEGAGVTPQPGRSRHVSR
ncbi:MAG TPA: DMT family transporter [Thermaerobacter sp.]